ncbi:DUF411 domain-containing protein [Paeniroseomonas aquatica]
MKRRFFFATFAATGIASDALGLSTDQRLLRVWRDPNCNCCTGWVRHMRGAGFIVEDNLVASADAVRRTLGIPADLLSCHASSVEGYALEGHVPAGAVLRLLSQRPGGVRGLAVPYMPIGSPGMEVPNQPDDIYNVIAFGPGNRRQVFMRFRGGQVI